MFMKTPQISSKSPYALQAYAFYLPHESLNRTYPLPIFQAM